MSRHRGKEEEADPDRSSPDARCSMVFEHLHFAATDCRQIAVVECCPETTGSHQTAATDCNQTVAIGFYQTAYPGPLYMKAPGSLRMADPGNFRWRVPGYLHIVAMSRHLMSDPGNWRVPGCLQIAAMNRFLMAAPGNLHVAIPGNL